MLPGAESTREHCRGWWKEANRTCGHQRQTYLDCDVHPAFISRCYKHIPQLLLAPSPSPCYSLVPSLSLPSYTYHRSSTTPVMSQENWPPKLKYALAQSLCNPSQHSHKIIILRTWVATCLGQMSDSNRKEGQAEMRKVIADAYESKALWTTDWDAVQLQRYICIPTDTLALDVI